MKEKNPTWMEKLFQIAPALFFNKTFLCKNKRILDNNKKIRNYTEAVTRRYSVKRMLLIFFRKLRRKAPVLECLF